MNDNRDRVANLAGHTDHWYVRVQMNLSTELMAVEGLVEFTEQRGLTRIRCNCFSSSYEIPWISFTSFKGYRG